MRNDSSMGNQDKYYDEDTDYWYKSDYLGYEGLSEYVVTELLNRSKFKDPSFRYVQYEMCNFKIGNKQSVGCRSKNFIKNGSCSLTLLKFFKMYYKTDIVTFTNGMSVKEQIEYVVNSVQAITGLSNFGAFLTLILELDAFILNDDRHYRNISMLRDESGRFHLTPIFDNGGSLLSDEYSYSGDDLDSLINTVESKPFSYNFDEQLDAAEILYGTQIEFPSDVNFLKDLKPNILSYYTEDQFKRVEYVLRNSVRKYSYLAKTKYRINETKKCDAF